MKAVVAAFNQEKALVGAFFVIVEPVVEPMDRFAALLETAATLECWKLDLLSNVKCQMVLLKESSDEKAKSAAVHNARSAATTFSLSAILLKTL